MTEITDEEAAEVQWTSSEEGKAAFRAAWARAKALGIDRRPAGMADVSAITYAAHLATAGGPGKVYLATAGEYSDYRVKHAFARREDAESYKLGDNDVLELEVHHGPVEVRYWHELDWRADWPDKEPGTSFPFAGNPYTNYELRDFDGNEKHAEHTWSGGVSLNVQGWDLTLVKKVYSEQRAQYLARKEGIS